MATLGHLHHRRSLFPFLNRILLCGSFRVRKSRLLPWTWQAGHTKVFDIQISTETTQLHSEHIGKRPARCSRTPLTILQNAVTDWMFAIIPIFVVRGTQMSRQARISVIAILCLGVVGSVCSIVRIFYVDVLQATFGVTLLKQAPSFAILSATELGIGIISICCATLRPLFQRYFGLSQSGYSSQRGHGHPSATGATATRRTMDRRSRTLGTEIGIEHDLELELGDMDEPDRKAGAITVTTLIAHNVEEGVGERKSQSSDKELL